MEFFDFGAFQQNLKMLSNDEIIFHILFGAFHDAPRIIKFVGLNLLYGFTFIKFMIHCMPLGMSVIDCTEQDLCQ